MVVAIHKASNALVKFRRGCGLGSGLSIIPTIVSFVAVTTDVTGIVVLLLVVLLRLLVSTVVSQVFEVDFRTSGWYGVDATATSSTVTEEFVAAVKVIVPPRGGIFVSQLSLCYKNPLGFVRLVKETKDFLCGLENPSSVRMECFLSCYDFGKLNRCKISIHDRVNEKNKSSLVSNTDDAEDEDIYVVLYLSLLNRSTGRKKKVSMTIAVGRRTLQQTSKHIGCHPYPK